MTALFSPKAALCALAIVSLGGCEVLADLGLAQSNKRHPAAITDAQSYTGSATGEQTREDYVPELQAGYGAGTFDCGTSAFVGGSGYCLRNGN